MSRSSRTSDSTVLFDVQRYSSPKFVPDSNSVLSHIHPGLKVLVLLLADRAFVVQFFPPKIPKFTEADNEIRRRSRCYNRSARRGILAFVDLGAAKIPTYTSISFNWRNNRLTGSRHSFHSAQICSPCGFWFSVGLRFSGCMSSREGAPKEYHNDPNISPANSRSFKSSSCVLKICSLLNPDRHVQSHQWVVLITFLPGYKVWALVDHSLFVFFYNSAEDEYQHPPNQMLQSSGVQLRIFRETMNTPGTSVCRHPFNSAQRGISDIPHPGVVLPKFNVFVRGSTILSFIFAPDSRFRS
ncbi:hypothetical protein C8R43DRAFT_951873 [Mycena crocata]|nr:hypothetical protein C8R43DRAFT_951873 [Mycena crocata]